MPELTLIPETLAAYLPHRGMNLMPDEVVLNEDRTKARSRGALHKSKAANIHGTR